MKRLSFVFSIVVIIVLVAAMPDCNPESDCQNCVSKIPSGFNFLKSYPVDAESKESVEFSYVLTKGTDYLVNVCDRDRAGMIVNLFNSQRRKVGTNELSGKAISAITFSCTSTGIYYIKYNFLAGAGAKCGGSSLSFKRPVK